MVDESFVLAGRDDLSVPRYTGTPRKSLNDILADLPQKYRDLPLVVLDHQPTALEEARQAGAGLEISGHTHYGQLWPFNLVVEKRYENPLGLLTMKVLLINGSPHPKGCTFTALSTVAAQIEKQGIETQLLQLGVKPIQCCIACGKCRDTGHCVFNADHAVSNPRLQP